MVASDRKWMLPSKAAFSGWLTQHLRDGASDRDELFYHQAVVGEFLRNGAPYRGLLVYHAVGTGKSRTALTVARAAAASDGGAPITVLLPASLRQNFVDEIQKFKDAEFGADRFEFVHYNGLSSSDLADMERANPFEDRIVVIDEVHNLTSMAVGSGMRGARLYKLLVSARGARIIALSATPLMNRPHELAYLVGLIKGYTKLFRLASEAPADAARVRQLLEDDPEIDQVEVEPRSGTVCFTRLPFGFGKNAKEPGFVVRMQQEGAPTPDDGLLQRAVRTLQAAGFVARKPGPGAAGQKLPDYVVPLPLAAQAFDELFIDEEHGVLRHRNVLVRRMLGCISYFSQYDDKLYPRVNATHMVRLPLSATQWQLYEQVRFDERKMEDKAKKQQTLRGMGLQKPGVFDVNGNVYRAFSRALCNFAFPAALKRPWPSSVRALLKEAELEGDSRVTAGGRGSDQEYERRLAQVLAALAERPALLRAPELQKSSPKFAEIMRHAAASPGPVLLYSQFRHVEGIGLMKLALDAAGWEELALEKRGREWGVQPARLAARTPRYVTFDDDKEKTKILLDVFNGNLDAVPPSVRSGVQAVAADQAHGSIVKLLMITQRGAEGISLRNVRQVHVMEPYWNPIRMHQVVGRAVRAGSHASLPSGEREVDVFQYVMTFTPEQLSDSFTIRTKDHSLTTDEYVLGVAERKGRIMDQVLGAMQSAAIDCDLHKAGHKDVACHAPKAVDDEPPAFDIHANARRADALAASRSQLPAAQVATYRAQQYAYDPVTRVLYDLDAYRRGLKVVKGSVDPASGRVSLYAARRPVSSARRS